VHALEVADPPLEIGLAMLGQYPGRVATVRSAAVQVEEFLDLIRS